MKRVLSLILVLAMALGMIPFGVMAAATGTADDPIIITANTASYTAAISEWELYYQYEAKEAGIVLVSFSSENPEGTAIEIICGDTVDFFLPGEDPETGDPILIAEVQVAEGDLVDIVAFTEAEDGAATVNFDFEFVPPEGTEENPITIVSSEPAQITVPANTTM